MEIKGIRSISLISSYPLISFLFFANLRLCVFALKSNYLLETDAKSQGEFAVIRQDDFRLDVRHKSRVTQRKTNSEK
jgi:hypothetical protein